MMRKDSLIKVESKGNCAKEVSASKKSKLDVLVPHPDYIKKGSSDDLVHMNWMADWNDDVYR